MIRRFGLVALGVALALSLLGAPPAATVASAAAPAAAVAGSPAAAESGPGLVLTGGSAADRAKVRRILASVPIPAMAKVEIRPHLRAWGTTWLQLEQTAIRRSVLHSSRARYVVIHEIAHQAQYQVARTADRMIAFAGGTYRKAEIQADCMVQAVAGRATAHVGGSYLSRYRHACSPAELRAARAIWSAVRR